MSSLRFLRVSGATRCPDREASLLAGSAVQFPPPYREAPGRQVLPGRRGIWLWLVTTTSSGDGHLGRHPGLPLPDRLNGSLAGPVVGPLWDQQQVKNNFCGKHPPVDTLPGEFVSTGWRSPHCCLIQKQRVRTVVAYARLSIYIRSLHGGRHMDNLSMHTTRCGAHDYC